MATRTGHFGHRRASGGNLTALVASLLQQQRAAEDRVMFDAYSNGGLGLDGKPVTDQSMRKYIAGRRNSISKDDPLYEEWNNRLIQLDFKIGEEKVQLAYKQGHVGAGAVASFYEHQLRTIPHNSEFYRDIAGRAAQWAQAGASAARGRARSRVSHALDAKVQTAQIHQATFSYLDAIVTDAAKRAGLIAGNETITDADATDVEALLKRGIPFGKQVITFDEYRKAALTAYRAFDSQIAASKARGNKATTLINGKMKFLNQTLVRLNTLDDRAKYEEARDAFSKATAGETDPRKILALAQEYAKTLSSIRDKALANEKNLATLRDPEFIGGLNNEITAITTGKASGPTVTDLQHTTGEGLTHTDSEDTAASIAKATADVENIANGSAYYGQDTYGGKFKVIQRPPAAPYDPTGRGGLGEDVQPSILNIDGQPTQVMLKGQPVVSRGMTDPQGMPVDNVTIDGQQVAVADLTRQQITNLVAQGYSFDDTKPTTVGYVFNDGGKTTYGVKQPDGSMIFTDNNPFNVTATDDKGTPSVAVGTATDQQGNTVPQPLAIDPTQLQNQSPLISDTTVSPRDLRAMAAASLDPQQAIALQDLANKRENDIYTSRHFEAYQNHGQDTRGQIILDTFRGALDTVSSLFGPREAQVGANTPSVPVLPKIGNATPMTFSPPPLTGPAGNVTPKTFGQPSGGGAPGNAAGGYLTGYLGPTSSPPKLPSTTSRPPSGGGAVGGAGQAVVDRYVRHQQEKVHVAPKPGEETTGPAGTHGF